MSKKLKVFSKKLFGRKSKMGPEDNLFRGSTSGSIMRDKIMKHIELTLVGQTISYEWCGAGVVEDLEGSGQEHHGGFKTKVGRVTGLLQAWPLDTAGSGGAMWSPLL
jgi:hypothetical protein